MRDKIVVILCTAILLVSTTRITNFWKNNLFDEGDNSIASNVEKIERADIIARIVKGVVGIGLIVCLVYSLKFPIKKYSLVKFLKLSFPLTLLIFYSFLSCFWSPMIAFSLKKVTAIFFLYLAILSLVITNDPYKNTLSILNCYTIIVIISSIILIIFFPIYGTMPYEGRVLPIGVFGHKNTLGMASTFLFLLYLIYWKEISLKLKFLISVLLTAFLYISESRTSQMIFALSMLLFIYFIVNELFTKRFFSKSYLIVFSLSFVSLICLIILLSFIFIVKDDRIGLSIYEFILNLLRKDSTLTGRTDLWISLIFIAFNTKGFNCLIGSGFKSFFSSNDGLLTLLNYNSWIAMQAHNGFLNTFLDLGFIGLILFLFMIGHMIYCIIVRIRKIQILRSIVLLVITLSYILYNLVENPFLAQNFGGIIPFFIYFFCFCYLNVYTNMEIKKS